MRNCFACSLGSKKTTPGEAKGTGLIWKMPRSMGGAFYLGDNDISKVETGKKAWWEREERQCKVNKDQ